MRVARDYCEHRCFRVGAFDVSPQGGCQRVAETLTQSLNLLEAWRRRVGFVCKPTSEKEKLPRSVVCLRLYMSVARRGQSPFCVSQHHTSMPGYDVMPNLVRFVPPMF